MKRAIFMMVACACTTPRTTVEIAAPLASATVVPVYDEVAVPRGAKRVAASADGPWAADFAPSKSFATVDVPDARRVLLTWRVGKSRVERRTDPDEDDDYPADRTASIELVVRARNETRVISFGSLCGNVEPTELSWCAKTREPFAATFSIGLAQGDDQMAIVRDGRTLHVLHRETSDGSCEEVKQGPLDVCDGSAWERVADVRLAAGAELYETVEQDGKPFECGME